MSKLEFRIFYERNLPHIQPPGAMLFVTYRLAGSIPTSVLNELLVYKEQAQKAIAVIEDGMEQEKQGYLEQRRLFGIWDKVLDAAETGPCWLSDPPIAQEVADSLHYLDGQMLYLDSYCIMSNHVHVVFEPMIDRETDGYFSVSSIMHSHKRYTARKANEVLEREGQFWQHESYDHYVRDESELERIRRYVIMNPVSAGLVEQWDEWPWTYCRWL